MIKVIVIILAIVVVSLGAIAWGLQRYMVYSDNGGKLVLPWAQQTSSEGGASSPPKAGGAAVSEPNVSEVVTSQSTTTQEPSSDTSVVSALRITQDQLLNGDISAQLKEKKANGVVLEMKASSGKLSYVSHLDLASQLGTSAKTTAGQQADPVAQAVTKLKEKGVYLIAYVDCFEDEAMGNQHSLSILTNSGYLWHGPNNNVRWGNPTRDQVRAYLVGIVGELSKLGFDEILLDHAGYPTEGNLNYIKKGTDYNSSQFATIISDFYTKAAKAAADNGAKLSVVTDQNTVQSGKNALSGQTLENLSKLGRVWMKLDANADEKALQKKVTEAGMNDHPLGVLTDTLESGKDYWQAVLDTPT